MLQTINFQGARQVNAKATYFRYESGTAGGADDSVRLRADGNDLGLYFPGDSIELPMPAQTWEITPVTPTCAGLVRLGVGRVQSARLSGQVRLVDEISDAITSFNASPALAVTAPQWATIVAAGSNTRGLVLRYVGMESLSNAAGTSNIGLAAAKSQPVDFVTPAQRYSPGNTYSANGVRAYMQDPHFNKLLPPGWGLYWFYAVGANAAQVLSLNVQYELL